MPVPPSVWYFAYGSNMQSATFRGRRGHTWTRALAARVDGWRLALDKPSLVSSSESVATLVADPSAHTFGVLYEISEEELAQLDLTEGVLIGHYRRIEVTAEPVGERHEAVRAVTLVSDTQRSDLRPSERYVRLLVEGAEEHGLPAEWIAYLRSVPAVPETDESRRWRTVLDESLAVLRKR